MKTCMILAVLIVAPVTSSAFGFDLGGRQIADENARRSILQEMAGYRDESLLPVKTAAAAAKTQSQLAQARQDFENWKMAEMRQRYAQYYEAHKKTKANLVSQAASVGVGRTPLQAMSRGWGSYFDGAKTTAFGPVVQADTSANFRYNYAKVRGIAFSQGAKADIVNAAIEEAKRQGVDPSLVLAIIQKESGYQVGAVSSAGAIGLMQLMPSTARDMGVSDPNDLFDVRTNLRAGIRYLRWMAGFLKLDINLSDIRQVAGNKLRALLASNNAGIGRVERWRKWDGDDFRIRFAETRNYVSSILNSLGVVSW